MPARYSRSTWRASGSSSTMIVRSALRLTHALSFTRIAGSRISARNRSLSPPTRSCADAAVAGVEPSPHVVQADGRPPDARLGRSVDRILDRHHQLLAVDPRRDRHGAALEPLRDAVPQRVLDQRLDDQRRDGDRQRLRRDGPSQLQPLAEADLLDGQELIDQRQLLAERDALERREVQRAAQEVAEQQAHPPRRRRIGGGQGADRVEAVEEEVRRQLRPQRPQLGLRRQRLRGGSARLGDARVVDGDGQVVQHRRQQEHRHGAAEHRRLQADEAGPRRRADQRDEERVRQQRPQ